MVLCCCRRRCSECLLQSSSSRTWRGTNPWIKFFVGTRSFNATKLEELSPVTARYMFRMTNALFHEFIMHVALPYTHDEGYVARPGSKFDLVPEKKHMMRSI